jgi:hypothetical protein
LENLKNILEDAVKFRKSHDEIQKITHQIVEVQNLIEKRMQFLKDNQI